MWNLVAASQVILGTPGRTGIQMQINACPAVRVSNIQVSKRLHDAIQLFLTGKLARHIVHLNEYIFVVGICTHFLVIDFRSTITISIVSVDFHVVGKPVTVSIR